MVLSGRTSTLSTSTYSSYSTNDNEFSFRSFLRKKTIYSRSLPSLLRDVEGDDDPKDRALSDRQWRLRSGGYCGDVARCAPQ